MTPADSTRKILSLAETLHRWLGTLTSLDTTRRDRIARYAEEVAATLQRAADGLARLEADPSDRGAHRTLVREVGRISGYLETIVEVLERHLDGRKLNGVKRRLEVLAGTDAGSVATLPLDKARIDRLLAAEGYFRALADGLRT